MKKIINIFQILSISVVIILIIILLIPLLIGIKPYIVLSGSMEPKIKTGSVAYINTHVDVQTISEGDIIGFMQGDKEVTHRVVSINENNTFVTKGDSNANADFAPVTFEQYRGKTIFSIPYLGNLINSFKTKTGKFIIGIIIGLNIVCIVFSEDKTKEEKNE